MPFRYKRTVITNDGGRVTTKTYTSDDPSSFNSSGMKYSFGGSSTPSSASSSRPRSGIRRSQPSSSGDSGPSGSSDASNSSGLGKGVVALGKRSVKPGPPSAAQSLKKIKSECLANGTLWEDADFPASSLSISGRRGFDSFEWKRPKELCSNPEFIIGGASRFDIKQGRLGDCWLLAAVASLTLNKSLFDKVVPPDQSFTDDYCGAFCFHFWHQGEWIEVVVDDRLPSEQGGLVFLQSETPNEFWSALLEKAYAKLMGSYENLKGGSTLEAMEDFSGGVGENFDLRKPPAGLFKIMLKANKMGSLMGCAIEANPNQLEARLDNGLVMGHAYSVTGVTMIDVTTPRLTGKFAMVRVRNPWGQNEWNGAWSDQSREWSLVSEESRRSMGLDFSSDGEFWMSFDDWCKNFTKLEICNLGPDTLTEEDLATGKMHFTSQMEHSAWIRRVSAGGCRNFLDTFWTNPQFAVTLTEVDEDDDDDLCTMIVALLQKDRRKKRSEGLDMLTIGYAIYKVDDESKVTHGPLEVDFFKYTQMKSRSPTFINTREVCGRHKLEPGTYVIVPSSFDPHEEADFLLRIFTEKSAKAGEMDQETGYVEEESNGEEPQEKEDSPQDEALRQSFQRISGADMEIDAYELMEILNIAFKKANDDFKFDGFTLETTRAMVAMMDVDRSGKLGFDEFRSLWNLIKKWKASFKQHDQDNSGTLSSYELRKALLKAGFRLSNETLATLVFRFSRRDGSISFDDFVLCAVRINHMIELFRDHEQQSGKASFALDDFIQTTLYS